MMIRFTLQDRKVGILRHKSETEFKISDEILPLFQGLAANHVKSRPMQSPIEPAPDSSKIIMILQEY
jgi:hypothetical protein